MGRTWTHILALAGLVAGCDPGAEFRAALPDEETVTTKAPGIDQSQSSLSSSRSALVGEKADFYTETYYTARNINLLGKAVVDLVEGISHFPPTKLEENRAVWGPFSDNGDPNEFMMTVEKLELRYDWKIEGKHKADSELTLLAAGTFAPEGDELGRGWFELDFDAIGSLDPTVDAKGRVAYAFEKTAAGLSVRLRFEGPNEAGEKIAAGYAFGRDKNGTGFILFSFPGDIEENGSSAEDVVIRSRWTESGAGRADVIARNGDLGANVAQASQCWDDRFVSRYEVFKVEGTIKVEVGDELSCVLEEAEVPSEGELPEETDVQNPFE